MPNIRHRANNRTRLGEQAIQTTGTTGLSENRVNKVNKVNPVNHVKSVTTGRLFNQDGKAEPCPPGRNHFSPRLLAIASILAASEKSLTLKPPIEWVQISIATLR